jgi:group I intron endonuclease
MYLYWIHSSDHSDPMTQGYIGIAENFEQRMFAHKSCAKTGKEETLYKAIRKHGWDNLTKEVLVIADQGYCKDLEQKMRPKARVGWNIAVGGDGGGLHLKGVKQSEQHLANRRKALIGRAPGFKGKVHTEEAKDKVRLAHLGKPKTFACKQKIGQANMKKIKINDVVFDSWKDANEATGIPLGSLSYLSKNVPTKGKWAGIRVERVM